MKTITTFAFALWLSSSAWAGDLSISEKGEALMDDDFSKTGPLKAPWVMPKGKWEVKDGALWGAEVKADKHAAVLHYNKKNHNLVTQFDFELHGAKFLHLSFNHAKGHHLWRLMITEKGLVLQKDKDKKDPNSKAERLAEAEVAIKPGERHTVTVEIVGEQIVARLDDQATLKASNPAFDTEKPNIRFIVSGESALLDNIKAWQAVAK
jgi:hypothetical protein